MKKYTKYIIIAVVVIVLLGLFLAFWRTNKDLCTVSLEGCLMKAKMNGFWGKMFASIGCVWNNMICVIKSVF